MTPEIIELEGRAFVPADQFPIPEWNSVLAERPQPILTLKDDDLFLLTDTLGNIGGFVGDDRSSGMGLFCKDTRFLSRLELQIEGRSPILLSSTADKGFVLSVLCTNPRIDEQIKAESIGIKRELVLNGGLFEEIEISNYSTSPVTFELSLSFDTDFFDLFEIRGYARERRGRLLRLMPQDGEEPEIRGEKHDIEESREREDGEIAEQELQEVVPHPTPYTPHPTPHTPHPSSSPAELTLAYQGLDGELLESRIEFSHRQPTFFKGNTAIWQLHLESHETQTLGYRLLMLNGGRSASTVSPPMTLGQAKAAELMEEQTWRQQVTRIRSDKNTFNQILERAEQDIYLLRQSFGKGKALSAGVPWFSTLFGRDSIIAASQILMLDSQIARETLYILAQYQGKVDDEWRDEQPGKILHEIRFGEMARCQEIPHTPYYGTVDATPLWLMLYAEYFAWTADYETLENLWPNALAAMDWIDRSCKQTSYLSYFRKSRRGLDNQGWKDSGDCIVNRRGQLAEGAIALCEVQAYVYAAKIRLAQIARMKKRIDLADRWDEEARDLKIRFNRDFWMEDQGFCALALDGDGKPVDSITSNPGHCLNLGIFTPEKAYSVAERLRAPDMFNGWGIRTLSSLSPAYNPMGYHIGSVWPHDNALTAIGLRSLGLIDQALELAEGILDMTNRQPYHRPPELFCGYERSDDNDPVQYPVACTPQAWATGSVFQLVQMMVNLVPDAPSNTLRIIDPALPESIHYVSLQNLRVGPTLLDLEFERSGSATACRVSKKRGNLRVIIEA
ncbi:amylo-alpha-1,6-glucosidase [Kovacikia minuta CCNUW1]|uniref:amylo-alpha-1,6-glucosidase n=1 Tax=Kovacikia minuta TaxID=2931930 RepID=UPI001CC94981|nr:amylo-alpha-1,6-glucosidase [Kovacikia minuta]UBF26436.1 amylo-alpha-1,6-glucosidase [Kovacikia minuta CCNUW1]